LDRGKLLELLRKRDQQIDILKRKLKTSRQVQLRIVRRAERQQTAREAREAQVLADGPSLALTKVGQSAKYTPAGTLALAIRRNIGTCSARSLAPVLLETTHHSTICGAEIRTAAALLASARHFHREVFGEREDAAASSPDSDAGVTTWRAVITAFRGDATNSAVCLGSKVHNLEADTIAISDPGPHIALAARNPGSWWNRHRQLADLQIVGDSTGAGTLALVRKHLASLGVPLWNVPRSDHLHVFVCTTDQGSDQAKFRRLALAESMPCDGILFMEMNCLMHQGQLCVRSGLPLADAALREVGSPCKVFATLAKLVNTWRDSHKAARRPAVTLSVAHSLLRCHSVVPLVACLPLGSPYVCFRLR
jgi:hypothetical protein